ncbi:MAG: hypothetical protein JSR98_07620 [Proteobacteria bacterium]|nr:hypothetical protein [Pseudomonadota bacterium]
MTISQLIEFLRPFRALEAHPLSLVVTAALLAALIEQRMAKRRTPDFSTAFRDVKGPPKA